MIDRRRLLIATPAVLLAGQVAAQTTEAPSVPTPAEVLSDPVAPVLGNPEGDLTLVEYFDYQCGYCKRMHPMLLNVVAEDGNVRLLMRDWPIFGGDSVYAAQVALGAHALGQYAAVSRALMSAPNPLTKGDVFAAVSEAGLTPAQALKAYRDRAADFDALLRRNDAQAAAFGFSGTPAFIIGNAVYPGAFINRQDLVDALAAARKRRSGSSI